MPAALGPAHTTPLYSGAQAAGLIRVAPATFRNWAVGYRYDTAAGEATAKPLITAAPPRPGRAWVPFSGLAEGFVLAAFRAAGVPLQRIRPAIEALSTTIGLPAALASEALMTDGAEILFDFGRHGGDVGAARAVEELVVVRNGQHVFADVVRDHLRSVTYDGGWITVIRPPGFGDVDVIVDPRLNFGRPTIAGRGVRVEDVLSRIRAGESARDVAVDYGLPMAEVRSLTRSAA